MGIEAKRLSPGDRRLLTFLWLIYGFAVSSVILGSWAEFIVAAVRGGVNQEWLGFAGAVLGGLMTIAAGIVAWIAAQRAIEANRAIEVRREHHTYTVIQRELNPKVEMFVRYWRVIQKTSRFGPDIKANGVALIQAIAHDGITDDWLDEMRRLGSDLGPIQRRELIDVLQGLRLVRDKLKAEVGDDNRANHFWLLNLRTMLSHFHRYLLAFDSEQAKRFDGFTKSPIDHRNMAEHVDPLVENFERNGNID